MDKIKSLLSPGASKDDEALYNTPDKGETTGPTGKVTGQGSHFGSTEPPVAPSAVAETPASVPATTATEPTPATSSLPTTERSGQAAIGETSTYSSTPIGPRDGTSSVVDHNSSDPTTFKKAETSSHAGVLPGAAETAALAAFNKNKNPASEMPGAFPATTSTNPYENTNIDPRVDSVGHRSVTDTEASHGTRDTALGTVGGGAASTAAYEAMPRETPSTAPGPATTTAAHTDSAVEEEPEKEKTSLKTKVLGALGIGAAGAASKERKASSSGADESGVPSGKPPSHHRKESIPTTAYPSGTFDSPRAIHPPVGGTTDLGGRHKSVAEINEQTRRDSRTMQASAAYAGGPEAYDNRGDSQARNAGGESHLGRDAAIGAGALGATGLAAHEYERSREPEPGTAQQSHGPSVHDLITTKPAATGTTGATGPAATEPIRERGNEQEESHHGRDAALGGAAVVGGGTLAEHERRQHEAEKAEKEREAAAAAAAHEHEKEMKAQQKAHEKEEKKVAKQEAKEEKAQEKAAAKEAKKEEKEAKKEEKAAAKEAKKEEKEAKKEEEAAIAAAAIERERKAQNEKKQKEAAELAAEEEKKKHEKEIAAAGVGTAAVGAGAYEAERHHKADEADKYPETAATEEDPELVKQREKEQKEAEVLALQDRRKREYEEKKAAFHKDQEERVQARIAEEKEKLGPSHGEEGAAAGIGAAAVGTGAYEAEKHHRETETPATTGRGDPAPTTTAIEQHKADTGHEVPSEGHSGTKGLTDPAAADTVDHETHGPNKLHKEPKTKKPGFFRRIFKRRKNQDTGDSEDYSTDEEHDGTETQTYPHHAETATQPEGHENPTEVATGIAHHPEVDEIKYTLTGHPKSGDYEA